MKSYLHKDYWPPELKAAFEERAAIMEYHGNMDRADAEHLAEEDIRTTAEYGDWIGRNKKQKEIF